MSLKKLLAPLRNYPKEVFWLFVRGIFFGVFGIWMWFLMKDIIDALTTWAGFGDLRPYILLIVLLHVFKDAFSHFFRNLRLQLKNSLQKDLYANTMHRYLGADFQHTELLGTWKANSILQKWCDNRVFLLESLMQDIFAVTLPIILGVIIIWSYFWRIWVVLSVVITWLLLRTTDLSKKNVYGYRKQKKEIYTEADRHIVRTIMSKQDIVQNSKSTQEVEQQTNYFFQVSDLLNKESRWMIWFFDGPRMFTSLLRIGIVIYSIRAINEGIITVGTFALLWMITGQISQELFRLTEWILSIQQQVIHIEKLRETFDDIPPLVGYETGKAFLFTEWKIDLQAITFWYTPLDTIKTDTTIFKDFTLTVAPGKKTALVGPSGAGKTTLVKLIAGYLRPQTGAILVDGQNLQEIALKTYYPHIWYLTQEASVFDGTILENLEYGIEITEDAEQKIIEDHQKSSETSNLSSVISLAKCERIYDLPAGLATEIGERGIRLSGGQRQRLAIAKLMLRNPQIIILDEPTSALDSESEHAVTEALQNLFKNRTVIIIAHRLQTVKAADEIIYLWASPHGAQILERGTHQQLITKNGAYARMVELQSWF
jgi:ABC-type multidrug transport system fused ATPase/permease subunit